jgi:hypothetical protein
MGMEHHREKAMDEFEKRLKRDAHAVHARVSPELRSRIDASLRAVDPVRAAPDDRRSTGSLWWASSLTGLAAVLLLVVIVNLNKPDPDPVQEVEVAGRTVPPMPADIPLILPELDIRSADFTSPLEEELLKLQADIEKARENVREDVDFTF